MFGWFVGRSLRRNALRDVDTAQNVMTPDARLAVARRVIAQMVLTERQRDAANGAIDLQQAVLRQATADKRALLHCAIDWLVIDASLRCYRRIGLFDRFWPFDRSLPRQPVLNAWVEVMAIASTAGRAAATKITPHEGQGIVSHSKS